MKQDPNDPKDERTDIPYGSWVSYHNPLHKYNGLTGICRDKVNIMARPSTKEVYYYVEFFLVGETKKLMIPYSMLEIYAVPNKPNPMNEQDYS